MTYDIIPFIFKVYKMGTYRIERPVISCLGLEIGTGSDYKWTQSMF